MAEDYYKQTGAYYGYPECCVKAFYQAKQSNGLVICMKQRCEAQQKTCKNGFVPCLWHAEQILAKKITVEELISSNRQCPKPFSKPEQSLGKYQHCTDTLHCSQGGRTQSVAVLHSLLG